MHVHLDRLCVIIAKEQINQSIWTNTENWLR